MSISPTPPQERIQSIDVIRGFALLGIVLVNINLFCSPIQTYNEPLRMSAHWIDRAAVWLVRFLADGEFYYLFSFLFGLGFALQISRITKEVKFTSLYIRKLIALVCIGLIHAIFIWSGDILTLYALLGFLLPLFSKARPKIILVWVVIFLALPVALNLLGLLLFERAKHVNPEIVAYVDQLILAQRAHAQSDIIRVSSIYSSGSFVEITAQRLRELPLMLFLNFSHAPNVLAMFLVGLYFARRRIFQEAHQNSLIIKKSLNVLLVIGVIGSFTYTVISMLWRPLEPTYLQSLAVTGYTIGTPALCLFYMSVLTLLTGRVDWQQKLKPLAVTGRMSLSNYLGQSLFGTFIFYGYGLGLFGQIQPAERLILAFGIYAVQVFLSVWWLRMFQFGPVEWLWRSFVYLKLQPLRRTYDTLQPGL